jgi:hypothetical protein
MDGLMKTRAKSFTPYGVGIAAKFPLSGVR